MRKIYNNISTVLKGRIVSNTLSLYAVQGVTNLLNLLVMPFLLRALNPQGYGSIVFAQSLIGFAEVFVDFGFNFTAARGISIERNNPQKVAQIYWITTVAKLFLLSISLAIIALIVVLTPRFRADWPVFAASTLLLIGNVAFPKWYFQGMESLKKMAMAQVMAKIIGTASIVFLVRSSDDLLIAAIILSSPLLFGTIAALLTGTALKPSLFYMPKFYEVRQSLKESAHLFVASMSTVLYMNTNSFVLGLMCGDKAVGLYGLGMRIIGAIQALATPLLQSVFPRASQLFVENEASGWSLVRKTALVSVISMSLISLVLFFMADPIVHILGGVVFDEAVMSVRIISIVPLLLAVEKLLSEVVMVNIGLSKLLPKIYFLTGLINIIILLPLIHFAYVNGAAVSLVIAESVAIIMMLTSIKKWGSTLVH